MQSWWITLADSKEQFKLDHPSDYWRVHALLQSIPPFYERKIEQDNSSFFCKRTKEAFCMLLCQYRVYWLASLDWRWLSHFINLHLWPTKDLGISTKLMESPQLRTENKEGNQEKVQHSPWSLATVSSKFHHSQLCMSRWFEPFSFH